MSKFNNILLIKPPASYGDLPEEKITSPGHICPYCKGTGWFWDDITSGDSRKELCKVCSGVGKIDAEITIKWIKHGEIRK